MKAHPVEGKGTYALVLRATVKFDVRVGALGEVSIDPGYLVYVGSAFGPGGLAGRLRHHLRPVERPHWHVDYIRQHAETLGAWLACGSRRLEHEWAASISKLSNARPQRGFGSSDCDCEAHLFHLRRSPCGAWLEPALRDRSIPEGAAFRRADRLVTSILS